MSLHPAPDDDGDWIAALRGQPPAGAAPRTLDEAARIRAALRRQPPAEGEAESGLDALLFRLRREGLLARGGAPLRPQAWYALAAGLAAMAIALPLGLDLYRDHAVPDESALTRALPPPPQRLLADDPAATARELSAALRAAGAQVEAVGDGPHPRLRVEIPAERRAASADILARAGLTLPPPGQPLRIDIPPRREPDTAPPATSNPVPHPRNGGSR